MRVRRENPIDLGFALYCFHCYVIDSDELSSWAARAIDEEDDPPSYLYELLDYRGYLKDIDRLIGFTPENGLDEDDWQYLIQIGVRRGKPLHSDVAYAANYEIPVKRRDEIDRRVFEMFRINVNDLPPLELNRKEA